MSHLSETIGNFDISTQILFNRTLVQVGLCAFRAGLVYESQNTLQVCICFVDLFISILTLLPRKYVEVGGKRSYSRKVS